MKKYRVNKKTILSSLMITVLLLSMCTLSIGAQTVNLPPPVPTVTGPGVGDVGSSYTFCAVATFGCSSVSYQFSWGDGTTSSWYSSYSSGQQCCKSYSWDSEGTYCVKARSKAPCGHISGWSACRSIVIGEEEPSLSYSPSLYNFGSMNEGQTDTTTFKIWNSGAETLTYSLSENCGWVSVTPTSGSSTGEHDIITVSIDTTGLSAGRHNCYISITSNGGSGTFTATATIIEGAALSYDPHSHNFGDIEEGQTKSTTFEIWNSEIGTLEYALIESCDWIDVLPINGDSHGEHDTITINMDTTGLSLGDHTCNITISSNAGSGIFVASLTIIEEPSYPDLDCDGSLGWTDVKPSDTVTGGFTVENIGDSGSKLNWEITDYPDWGTWTFTPKEGNDLTPEDSTITIQVSVVVPDEQDQEFSGEVKIVNKNDSSDYELIQISLVTPKNKIAGLSFLHFFENHPYIFSILKYILGL